MRLSINSLLLSVICCLVSSACLTPPANTINTAHINSNNQLVNQLGYSTVALVYTDADNKDNEVSNIKPYCTGVWLNTHQFITAYHCVQMMRRMQTFNNSNNDIDQQINDLSINDKDIIGLSIQYVEWLDVSGIDKEPFVQHLARLIKVNPAHDLALLDSVGSMGFHSFVRLTNNQPQMLEGVEIVGHTHGFYWTFLIGSVSGYRSSIPHTTSGLTGPYLQIEAPIHTGNSGGGCFNEQGELIGIASFIVNFPEGSIFIPSSVITKFIK